MPLRAMLRPLAVALAAAGCAASDVRLTGGALTLTWQDCGAPHGKVDSVEPSTLTLGQSTTISGKGSVDEDVAGGSYSLTVKSGPITLLTHTGDICKADTINLPLGTGTLNWQGLNCPQTAGAVELALGLSLAASIPSSMAKVTIEMKAQTTSGDGLMCLSLQTAPAAEATEVAVQQEEPAVEVAVAEAAQVSGGALTLTWQDCGAPHGHVDSVSPTTLTLGQTTTISGKGAVDEQVTGGSYSLKVKSGLITLLTHTGDICKPETINLPLGVGTLNWQGLNCPQAAGAVELALGLSLAGSIPSSMAKVTIEMQATATSGDGLMCLSMQTAPAVAEAIEVQPAVEVAVAESEQVSGGALALTWEDCGAAHGHVDSVSPTTLTLGQATTISGKGAVDEQVTGGSYSLKVKSGLITVLTHSGDICKPETINLPLGAGTLNWQGLNCPQAAGAVELALGLTLAASIPSSMAKVDIEMQATATSGDGLMCLSMHTAPVQAVVTNVMI